MLNKFQPLLLHTNSKSSLADIVNKVEPSNKIKLLQVLIVGSMVYVIEKDNTYDCVKVYANIKDKEIKKSTSNKKILYNFVTNSKGNICLPPSVTTKVVVIQQYNL